MFLLFINSKKREYQDSLFYREKDNMKIEPFFTTLFRGDEVKELHMAWMKMMMLVILHCSVMDSQQDDSTLKKNKLGPGFKT